MPLQGLFISCFADKLLMIEGAHVISIGQVSVSEKLYTFVHALWMQSAPIGELS